MIFADLIFIYLFLPLNILCYRLARGRNMQNIVLVVFSLMFYAFGEPLWVFMFIGVTFSDYTMARLIEKHRGKSYAVYFMLFSVVVDFGLLFFFKYGSFFMLNINALLGTSLPVPGFSMPIGISFYTFQTVSYVIDVYRGNVKAQPKYHKYLLYVSLYFQLVAGPIVRYSDVEVEIDNRQSTWKDMSRGTTRFAVGLFKKAVVANAAGALVAVYMNADISKMTVLGSWFGVLMYSLQIYYDFSAYSDMAIGLGWMFGFKFLENFNYPYISRSASEFWRRWHISLGSFFRDYVYIPLGGNRKHVLRNLLVVWFLTGFWHGAAWNFILWGLYFGVLIIAERLFLQKILDRIPAVFGHAYLILAVMVGWVMFYFTDFARLLLYLKGMFGGLGLPFYSPELPVVFLNNIIFTVGAVVFCAPVVTVFKKFTAELGSDKQGIILWLQPIFNIILIAVSTAMLVGQTYNPFLYSRF